MPSENDITLVVTSCGRSDLLARTLESFYCYSTNLIKEVIIAEDFDRIGQVRNIDRAYERVTTPYVLHWEEDWLTLRGGFMGRSLDILRENPLILQVWLRAHNDTNGHPLLEHPHYVFPILDPRWTWGGFSWNPGLRRKSDWERIGGYMKHWQGSDNATEYYLSKLYADEGMVAAILPNPEGYVEHIGWGRSTQK